MAKVLEVTEFEDGSAELRLDLTPEEVQILLNDAITRAIKNTIEKYNETLRSE